MEADGSSSRRSKALPFYATLNQPKLMHIFATYFCNIDFNIIHPSSPRSSSL